MALFISSSSFCASSIAAIQNEFEVSEETKKIAAMMLEMDLVSFPMLSYVNEYINEVNAIMPEAFMGNITVEDACKTITETVQAMADASPA